MLAMLFWTREARVRCALERDCMHTSHQVKLLAADNALRIANHAKAMEPSVPVTLVTLAFFSMLEVLVQHVPLTVRRARAQLNV